MTTERTLLDRIAALEAQKEDLLAITKLTQEQLKDARGLVAMLRQGVDLVAKLLAADEFEVSSLRARQIRVVDDDGRPAIVLHATKDGGALGIFGPDGRVVANLAPDAHGSGCIVLGDSAGRPMLLLSVREDGGQVQVTDAAGRTESLRPR